jgi:hypothetical protein
MTSTFYPAAARARSPSLTYFSLDPTMRTLAMLAMLFAVNAQARPPAEAALFESLRDRLVGTWTFVEDGKSYDATFEAVSHGRALLEKNSGYIAVYCPDEASVSMTLYTRDGNQPRFRATGADAAAQSIKFVFRDITNWKNDTEHINGLEIVFKDQDHIVERWETLQPNGKKSTFNFELTRKRA